MSEVLIINASPRREGTSFMLCKRCQDYIGGDICQLYADLNSVEWLFPKIKEAKTIIISGPCYIDTYPAHVVYLLEEISKHPEICHGQKVYGIINGGMPYVHTHEAGLRMLKLFCKDCNMQYQGGFVIGFGPILNGKPLEKHIFAKKLVPAYQQFLEHMKKSEESPKELYDKLEKKFPALLLRVLSYSMNKKINKNLKKHGFHYIQPSPYWEQF
jgi:hypothetical protein